MSCYIEPTYLFLGFVVVPLTVIALVVAMDRFTDSLLG